MIKKEETPSGMELTDDYEKTGDAISSLMGLSNLQKTVSILPRLEESRTSSGAMDAKSIKNMLNAYSTLQLNKVNITSYGRSDLVSEQFFNYIVNRIRLLKGYHEVVSRIHVLDDKEQTIIVSLPEFKEIVASYKALMESHRDQALEFFSSLHSEIEYASQYVTAFSDMKE